MSKKLYVTFADFVDAAQGIFDNLEEAQSDFEKLKKDVNPGGIDVYLCEVIKYSKHDQSEDTVLDGWESVLNQNAKYQELSNRAEELEKEIEAFRVEFAEYKHKRNEQEFDRLVKQEQSLKLKQRIKGTC